MSTLTAANAIITLAIPGLFPIPQQLQGFATDDVFDVESIGINETMMGVDGIQSGGFVFVPIKQTFALQADSASNLIFETWAATMAQVKDAYFANGRTTLPATGRTYVCSRGFLVAIPPAPSAGKLLKLRKYTISWQSMQSAPA